MGKKIEFEYNDKKYTLEYNRAIVKRMEASGFDIDNVTKQPLTAVTMLFQGAFQMHHPGTNERLATEILEALDVKDELLPILIEMYQEPIATVISEAPAGKAVSWKAV